MENFLVLNKSIEGKIILSLFIKKALKLERKFSFLYFDNREDIKYLFSFIKTDWRIEFKFKSKSKSEKVFIIENFEYLLYKIQNKKADK